MGNQQTNQTNQAFYQQLRLVRPIANHKSLMQNPQTSQLYVSVQSTFPSESQALEHLQEIKKRIQPSHQYYLGPLKYFFLVNNNFCSKQFKIIQIFTYEEYTLREEIENRQTQNRYFNDREIWSVLCSCVLAMANFTRLEIVHLELSPNDIILNSEGQIKVISHDLSEYTIDYNFKEGLYYAPETLKSLRNKSSYQNSNKAGVFTLGMTILSAILLEDLSQLYSSQFNLDIADLNQKIMAVQNSQMRDILVKMLKVAPYDRISFTQLEDMLYSILENNTEQEVEDQQLEKLEESIYRIGNNFDRFEETSDCLPADTQDSPSCAFECPTPERQNVDESSEQQNQEQSLKSEDDHRILADKTNTQTFQSSDILKMNKNNNFVETAEASERENAYYVNENYNRGRYEGYKQFGMRHGYGTFHYEEGGRFSGQWRLNKMEGRGALYYSSGDIAYEGEWKDDQLHGYGVLYNQNPIYITSEIDWHHLDRITSCWVKYEGNFEEDQKNGDGTLCLSNGQYYRGQFKSDQPNGKGLFRNINGKLIKGVWQNGIFVKLEN